MEGTGIEGGSEEVEGMKGTGIKEEGEGTEGTKSGEVHNAASKSSMDESRLRESEYP